MGRGGAPGIIKILGYNEGCTNIEFRFQSIILFFANLQVFRVFFFVCVFLKIIKYLYSKSMNI